MPQFDETKPKYCHLGELRHPEVRTALGLAAGLAKLVSPGAAYLAARAYAVLPDGLVRPVAVGPPMLEAARSVPAARPAHGREADVAVSTSEIRPTYSGTRSGVTVESGNPADGPTRVLARRRDRVRLRRDNRYATPVRAELDRVRHEPALLQDTRDGQVLATPTVTVNGEKTDFRDTGWLDAVLAKGS